MGLAASATGERTWGMSSRRVQLDELLEALESSAIDLLEVVGMPAYIVDNDLRIRWQNAASRALVGDLRGRLEGSSQVVAEDLCQAREAYALKQGGAAHTEVELSVRRQDGTLVRIAVSSVPLKDTAGVMIGSFGLIQVLRELEPSGEAVPQLSPRERETVRNHVKRVLRSMDASSRVEAVAKARRAGLV